MNSRLYTSLSFFGFIVEIFFSSEVEACLEKEKKRECNFKENLYLLNTWYREISPAIYFPINGLFNDCQVSNFWLFDLFDLLKYLPMYIFWFIFILKLTESLQINFFIWTYTLMYLNVRIHLNRNRVIRGPPVL